MVTATWRNATAVLEDDEAVEQSEADRGDDEEVHGRGLEEVVSQEGAPCLRRRLLRAQTGREPSGDGGLRHAEAQLEQLSVNPGRAPPRVVRREAADEGPDFIRGARTTSTRRAPAPEEPEARAVPGHHGVRLHDDQEFLPPRPQPGQADP